MGVGTPIHPSLSDATRTAPAIVSGLEEGCKAIRVVDDLELAIPLVHINYFETALLPPLRQGLSVAGIIAQLQQAGHLNNVGRWQKLFDAWPSKVRLLENDVFQDFERIADEVRIAAEDALRLANPKEDLRPTTVFKCHPDKTPGYSTRNDLSKPDSYPRLNLDHPFSLPHTVKACVLWDDIVAPGEFKKRASVDDINDNNSKVMWSMNHVMRESLRRRFVFGYTIEDVNMRLWYLNCSDALVSTQFSFLEDCYTLVHFLLSIMYALPEDLGYDTTMRRVPTVGGVRKLQGEDSAPQYDISVFYYSTTEPERRLTQHVYRTRRIVSNIGAEAPRGRGTRVWEVVRLDEKGKPVGPPKVLKDCWIDSDRTREGDILEQLRASAQTDAQKQELDRCFLTVDCHGDVYINGKTASAASVGQALYPSGINTPSPAIPRKTIEYDDKSHYRIVFHELGVSIDKLDSAFKIFRCLALTIPGLQAMHECGWVHRDISMGNLLVVDGMPKIIDLEYAKRVGDDSKMHKTRTGTDCFMPIEIKSQAYEFQPANDATSAQLEGDDTATEAVLDALRNMASSDDFQQSEPERDPADDAEEDLPVRLAPTYNPVHDLEGFWWTSVILTIFRKLKAMKLQGQKPSPEAEAFHDFMLSVFEKTTPRRQSMTNKQHFAKGRKGIDSRLQLVGEKLEAARFLLVTAYRAAEVDITSINHTAADAIYPAFKKIFADVAATLQKQRTLHFEPLNAKFIKPQEESAPAYDGLSLDSRTARLGKRTREDTVARLPTLADDVDVIGSSFTGVKRARLEDFAASNASLPTSEEEKRGERAGGGCEGRNGEEAGAGDDGNVNEGGEPQTE